MEFKKNKGAEKMKIGVISDTHIPMRVKLLPPVIFKAMEGVDLILHAGDIVSENVLIDLKAIAPLEAVSGNVDPFELQAKLPRKKILNLNGFRIGLIHGDGRGGKTSQKTSERAFKAFEGENVNVVVFGHSHKPFNEWRDGILLFNPGSLTDPRRQPKPSYGIIYLEETIRGEIYYLERD